MKKILTLISFSISFIGISQWSQKGPPVSASNGSEEFGIGTDISEDGNTFVAGGSRYNSFTGVVRVYDFVAGNWIQRGFGLIGEASYDNFGEIVAISNDGNVIACGAPGEAGVSATLGYIKTFEWSGTEWIQRGPTFESNTMYKVGEAIDLDSSGNTLAIGIPGYFEGNARGGVLVYDWDGLNWNLRGDTITQTMGSVALGHSVSLSAQGNYIATGASNLGSGFGAVYNWDGIDWNQLGGNIAGLSISGTTYGDISISGDGKRVALGQYQYEPNIGGIKGALRVFEYNGFGWLQLGNTILGDSSSNGIGKRIDLSKDGLVVAGSNDKYSNSGYPDRGMVMAYYFDGVEWQPVFSSIQGLNANYKLGVDVALSGDGQEVIVGLNLNNVGQVRIYETEFYLGTGESYSNDLKVYPNPVNGNVFRIDGISVSTPYSIYNLSGQLIESGYTSGIMDVSQINDGMYLLQLHTVKETYYLKFVKE